MRDLKAIERELTAQVAQFKITMRRTVNEAVKIGGLLTEAKAQLDHGEFMPWCDKYGISWDSAKRYIGLFDYRSKISNLPNLQAAYKLIETEEGRRKNAETADSLDRINTYKETGEKPEGWTRADAYRMNKQETDAQFKERVEKIFEEKKADRSNIEDKARQVQDEARQYLSEKQRLLDRMRLTGDNAGEPIFDALLEYLLTKDEGERLEACHNIIKFCKVLANELQRRSVSA